MPDYPQNRNHNVYPSAFQENRMPEFREEFRYNRLPADRTALPWANRNGDAYQPEVRDELSRISTELAETFTNHVMSEVESNFSMSSGVESGTQADLVSSGHMGYIRSSELYASPSDLYRGSQANPRKTIEYITVERDFVEELMRVLSSRRSDLFHGETERRKMDELYKQGKEILHKKHSTNIRIIKK